MSKEGLEQTLKNWQEKLAYFENELSITASSTQKFELRKRIEECQQEIQRITKKIEFLNKKSQSKNNKVDNKSPDLISFQTEINVHSETKVDCTNLHNLLAKDKWKEANEETFNLILKLTSKEVANRLRVDDINQLPCQDLDTIEQLWQQYSNGKFGFAIQNQIYQRLVADTKTQERWEVFGERVGWGRANWLGFDWKPYLNLTFASDAPLGHLPVAPPSKIVHPNGTLIALWTAGHQIFSIALWKRLADCSFDNSKPFVFSSISEDLPLNLAKTNSNINPDQGVQMKGITWLHLSDWHQKGEEFGRRVVRDRLIEDLTNRAEISPDLAKIDFIVFSGDLANSGSRQEYEAAKSYLLDPVLKATNLKPDKLFFVPGNHDFDRSKFKFLPTEIRQPFQSETEVNGWLDNQESRNEVLKPFKAYKEFITQYNNQKQPDYASVQILEINDKKVGLLGINSALMTARNKDGNGKIADQGFLVVGEPQIHTSLQSIRECEIKIAVLHHPFDWLTEFDRRRIKPLLGEDCHFILCGHEHQSRVERVSGTDGDYVFIPAGASYDRPNFPNSYNFVHLNLDNDKGTVYLRKWSRARTKWIKNEEAYENGQFSLPKLPFPKL